VPTHAPSRTVATAAMIALLALCGCGGQAPADATGQDRVSPGDAPATDDSLTAAQARGRRLFRDGIGGDGKPVVATLGGPGGALSAALVTCAGCHGRDGLGRPEGGIFPPDVTWNVLSKSSGATDRLNRRRPAYTEATLARALSLGVDPDGRPFGSGMPRYRLSIEEFNDLAAYLKVVGAEADPGVSPTSVRLGAVLPPEAASPGLREVIARTLSAYIDDVNRRGGLSNRRLELRSVELPPNPADAGREIRAFLDRDQPFALVAPFAVGIEVDLTEAVRRDAVPVVGPLSSEPSSDPVADRSVFFLQSGLAAQARALAVAAMEMVTEAGPGISVLRSDDTASVDAAEAFARTWEAAGRGRPDHFVVGAESSERLVRRLADRGIRALVCFAPAGVVGPLLAEADRAAWHPLVFLPGLIDGRNPFDLPPGFDGRVVLSFPYLPDDTTAAGREEYARLARDHGLPGHHRAAQRAVLSACKVFEEGARRCGRDLGRARLIERLEQLQEFATGYTRPVSFGPNRRVGADGAYVVTIDLAGERLRPTPGWIGVSASP
jgi:ABC-type branched-subunit amino acid transport system substrate-binding protein/cytochrome c553